MLLQKIKKLLKLFETHQHEFTKWEFHYGHSDGDWETRYCKTCGKSEERDA